jgi:hypothetical protein
MCSLVCKTFGAFGVWGMRSFNADLSDRSYSYCGGLVTNGSREGISFVTFAGENRGRLPLDMGGFKCESPPGQAGRRGSINYTRCRRSTE